MLQTGTKKFTIAIGGPKGVGKSSILSSAVHFLPYFKVISAGVLLQKIAQAHYGLNFVDLPGDKKQAARRLYCKEVIKEAAHTLLDIHFGEFEDGGYPCVIPQPLLPHITNFVLITSSPEAIHHRRKTDGKSRRQDMASIQLNVLGEQVIFDELTARYQKEGIVIHNGDILHSTQQLVQFIQKVVHQ